MKFSFLEKFEEKFYFKTSHFFWHLLTGLGGLALVVGLLILLWGITPSLKPGVKKQKYPQPVKVTAEEIKLKIQPPVKPKEVSPTPVVPAQPTPVAVQPEAVVAIDTMEQLYLAAIDSLKKLIPPEKFGWESKGHWVQDWYQRKWVVDYCGINDRLKSAFSNIGAENFVSKKQLLDAYIDLIALFPENQRYAVLKSAIEYSKTDVPTSIANMELLKATVPNFGTDKSDFIESLATFGKKNPRDGRTFIEYVNTIMPKFDPEIRSALLTTLINSYYNYFNLIEKQQEATNFFLDMQANFAPEDQVKALGEYYRLFTDKNYTRAREIEQIDSEYESGIRRAESVLAEKKAKKASYRSLGLKAVGGSIIFIAIVALFLVLLSIQRNVRLLRETGSVK